MKTLFRVLSLAILLTAFSALSFAQDANELATLFEKFKTEAKAACGEREPAMATGKTIVEKFGADELNKDVIDYVKKKMAAIEKEDPRCKLNKRYDASYKAKNWTEFLDVSKQLMAMEGDTPLGLDILLTHVSVGFDRGATDADSISNAKMALARLDAGKVSQTKKWGVFEPFNTKENAQGWMNYIIGTTMYGKLNQKKEALPYIYKTTMVAGDKKGDPNLYTAIGSYYFAEAVRLDGDYRTKFAANNNQDNDETKAILALARGTADRAADAFGRALKLATKPDQAQLKTSITKDLTDLYKFRFNLKEAKQADVDKYVADLVAKPMPDPATPVTPVVEEVKPTTTTTSTTPTTSTNTTTTTTSNTNKPAANTTKPVAATTTKTTTTTTKETTATTNKPTTTKKPLPKKKGTR